MRYPAEYFSDEERALLAPHFTNLDRPVVAVSYDAFGPLALNTFHAIAAEIQARWGDDLNVWLEHFQGRLEVGGASVVIAIGSGHRDESFAACRYAIEQIKHRSPIWKQEHYVDGDDEWIPGHSLRPEIDPDRT